MSRIAAGFIVYRWLEENVQYLLLQTSYGIHHWTPPKGHVDEGETLEDAAVRETEEEAGLSKDDLRVHWDFRREVNYMANLKPKTVVYWLARQMAAGVNVDKHLRAGETFKEVALSSEHQDFRWLSLADACNLSVYDEMQQLLKQADAYIHGNQK